VSSRRRFCSLVITTLVSLGILSLGSAGSGTTEGRGGGEVDLLLSVNSDHERGNIDELLSDSDVSVSDQDSGVVDGFSREVISQDNGLESSLQELGDGQTQNVIELVLALRQKTESEASSHKGGTLEDSLGVVIGEGEELSGGLSQLGEDEVNSSDLSLILETVLTDSLQLRVQSILLEGSLWDFNNSGSVSVVLAHFDL